jgi:predicted O-methyltransferase YrrM
MQIALEQRQFMGLLCQLMGARRVLEIGVCTGYSSTCMALALPDEGELVACDLSEEWTRVASRYWAEAGVAHKIRLFPGLALDKLKRLLEAGESGTFACVFVDADKTAYGDYHERALDLLRPGGLVMVDKTLWNGAVLDPGDQTPDTGALRAFNEKVHADSRVSISLVPIGEGLTLARSSASPQTLNRCDQAARIKRRSQAQRRRNSTALLSRHCNAAIGALGRCVVVGLPGFEELGRSPEANQQLGGWRTQQRYAAPPASPPLPLLPAPPVAGEGI